MLNQEMYTTLPQQQCVAACTEPSTVTPSADVVHLASSCCRVLPRCPPSHEAPHISTFPHVTTKSGRRLEKLRVFVGFDSREELAYEVCRHSLLKHATVSLEIAPLKLQNLTNQGIYTRPRDLTESTEFSFTRFFTPFLAGFKGWALFVDCDFLYTADVRELAELIDDQYAVMCVHHNYTPKATIKMDGVLQTCYPRKNWSSMVLYNCAHPKHKLLTPELVNSASGAFLHRFMWLEDADIGEVPVTWNFLVGHNEVADGEGMPKAIHFTSGGPWFEAWKECEFAEWWVKERDDYWGTVCALREGKQPEERKLVDRRMHEGGTAGMHRDRRHTRLKNGSYPLQTSCATLCACCTLSHNCLLHIN